MALTASSSFLDELARKRARAATLGDTMSAATSQGIGVLQDVEKRDAAAAADGADRALRIRAQDATEAQQATVNAREAARDEAASGLRIIEHKNKADAAVRAQAADMADRRASTSATEFDQGMRLRTTSNAEATAAAAAARTAEDRALSRVPDLVAADAFPIDPAEREAFAKQHGVTVAQLDAEARRQSEARTKGATAAELAQREQARKEQDSQAQRARDYAAANASKTPKAPSPLDQARIDKITSDRDTATRATLDDFQQAEKKLARLDKIIEGADLYNTGPVADATASIASAVLPDAAASALGLSDRQTWKSNVIKELNVVIKEQAGAAVSASEMTRALAAELHTGLDDTAFDNKAREVRESYAGDVDRARQRLTPNTRAQSSSVAIGTAPLASIPAADLDDLTVEQLEALLAAGGG